MKKHILHSKLRDLQGDAISDCEGNNLLVQILKILDFRKAGEISIADAGSKIRKLAWKIAEDLRMDGLALATESDRSLTENLPVLLKV